MTDDYQMKDLEMAQSETARNPAKKIDQIDKSKIIESSDTDSKPISEKKPRSKQANVPAAPTKAVEKPKAEPLTPSKPPAAVAKQKGTQQTPVQTKLSAQQKESLNKDLFEG